MSSLMSSFIRKSLRLSCISFVSSIQNRSLSYFSSSSLPASSSSLLRKMKGHLDPTKRSSLLPVRFVSSSKEKLEGDENLDQLLNSEICRYHEGYPDLPAFEIDFYPGDKVASLEREFAGERITVYVHMPKLEEKEEKNGDAESGDEDGQQSQYPRSQVSLDVSIDKGEGWHLEVCCTAYPDKITIDSMLMESKDANKDLYEGPEFSDLSENVQTAFYKYLEVRGITSSLVNSLLDYLIKFENSAYLMWLEYVQKYATRH